MGMLASDSFTEASDLVLSSHTPEIGGSWIEHPHVNYNGSGFQVDAATDAIFATGTDASYINITPPSADYYAEADFKHVSTISQNVAACVRMHDTDDTNYNVRFNSGTTFEMRRIVNGAAATIGSSTSNIPSVGNFTRGRLLVIGDQLWFYVYVAGVLQGSPIIGPVTDANITAAGRAGVRNSGAASATTGLHLDNFVVGTIDAASVGHGSFVTNKLRPAIFKPGRAR